MSFREDKQLEIILQLIDEYERLWSSWCRYHPDSVSEPGAVKIAKAKLANIDEVEKDVKAGWYKPRFLVLPDEQTGHD